jgi:hypothetical protein
MIEVHAVVMDLPADTKAPESADLRLLGNAATVHSVALSRIGEPAGHTL